MRVYPQIRLHQFGNLHENKFSDDFTSTMSISTYFDKTRLLNLTTHLFSIHKFSPVKVCPQNPQKFIVPNTKELRKLTRQRILINFAQFLLFLQCISDVLKQQETQNLTEKLLPWLNSLLMLGCIVVIHFGHPKASEIPIYINGLIQFENKYGSKSIPKIKDLGFQEILHYSLAPLSFISSIQFPPCVVLGFHLVNPCKSSLIGYFLLPECSNCWENNSAKYILLTHTGRIFAVILKASVYLVNLWVWFKAVSGVLFIVAVIESICSMMMRDSLKSFWKLISEKRATNFCKRAKIYRSVQLQAVLCNVVQQDIMLGQTLFSILAVSSCLGLLIRFGQNANIILLGALIIVVIQGVSMIVVLNGAMVAVYVESKKTLGNIKKLERQNLSRLDQKWAKRFWKSCDKIKIKFGSQNFLEEVTILKCLDVAIGLTVQVLLLTGH